MEYVIRFPICIPSASEMDHAFNCDIPHRKLVTGAVAYKTGTDFLKYISVSLIICNDRECTTLFQIST